MHRKEKLRRQGASSDFGTVPVVVQSLSFVCKQRGAQWSTVQTVRAERAAVGCVADRRSSAH